MACERFRDALTDVAAGAPAPVAVEAHLASCEGCQAELHRLRQALAVADAQMAGLVAAEPSPELLARIRQAVAEASPSPAWRFGWMWPATAAAATLLVALAVWVGRGPSPSPEARVAVDGKGSAIPADPSSPGSNGAPRDDRAPAVGDRRSPPRARAATVGVPRDDAPEVLVPPGEGEALLRLVALVHRERLSPAGLGAAGQPSPDLAEPVPLEITPIEIVPLDAAETSGT
jgi:anti-sigma factor RsiW